MKTRFRIIYLLTGAIALTLCGCATNDKSRDDKKYSDMPWNTPQQWEGARTIPGMSPGY